MTEHLVGASLLPLMLEPLHGTLYFLLAKERHHTTWPEGSNLWTDLGGRQESGECAEQVAAREFVEETLGQVRFFEGDTLPRDFNGAPDIANALKQGHYVLQFSHVHQGTRFVTFVVQVPWDPSVSTRFEHARAAYAAQENPEPSRLEKSHLGLFSLCQVSAAVLHRGYLTPLERCCSLLTEALSLVLQEMQFHFPNLF
jgi:8-oxo-dGTP pyrophosphatase MutT (NUDIX family)